MLVSIETVKATAADDVLVVTKLDSFRLAGADGTGGLATVDFGGQSAGDLIDLSPSTKAMTVTFGTANAQVFATDTPALAIAVIGAEKVLGSAFADTLTGGAGNDVLAGGGESDVINGGAGIDYLFSGTSAGTQTADVLYGGDGDDWLIAEAGASATLKGNMGMDTFYVTRSDISRTVTINNPMQGDKLVWNGHQLTHGDIYRIDSEGGPHVYRTIFGYLGSHGEVYRLVNLDPATSGDLIITFADATMVTVHDWSQGKLGITLDGGALPKFDADYNDWPEKYPYPYSNLARDHEFLSSDWDQITGAQDALTTPGPIAAPVPPSAFVPGSGATPPDMSAGSLFWATHHELARTEGLAHLC